MKQILNEIRRVKDSKEDLRNFGLVVGAVFLFLGLVLIKNLDLIFVPIGLILVIFAILNPLWLKYLNKVWMSVAIVLGFFVSKLILVLIYLTMITTIKIILRSQNKKLLDLRINKKRKSYWEMRSRHEDSTSLEKQY